MQLKDVATGTFKITGMTNQGQAMSENMGKVDVERLFGTDEESKAFATEVDTFGRKVFGLLTNTYMAGTLTISINVADIVED